MVTFYATLSSKEQMVSLVNWISKLDFDVDAYTGHYILDAKSILGMLGIGLGKRIMLKAHTEDDRFLQSELAQLIEKPLGMTVYKTAG